MTKSKSQQELSLFSYLSSSQMPANWEDKPITIRELVSKLNISKHDLLEIIKPHKKTSSNPLGLINVKKVGNTKHYSLEVTPYDQLHKHIPYYIDGINQRNKQIIKNLNNLKPLFKDVKIKSSDVDGTILTCKYSNQKVNEALENISLLLSDIMQKSFLITYYKTLNQITPNKNKQADDDQKLCIKTFSDIVKKLRTMVGRRKNHQTALDSYLFRNTMIINRLDL